MRSVGSVSLQNTGLHAGYSHLSYSPPLSCWDKSSSNTQEKEESTPVNPHRYHCSGHQPDNLSSHLDWRSAGMENTIPQSIHESMGTDPPGIFYDNKHSLHVIYYSGPAKYQKDLSDTGTGS